tara:strand:+ start:2141 stop:3088 length:948 start_codon:yes stop_codon:yes gene_type:complete
MINYRSYNDLCNILLKNKKILPKNIDLIVGVPRSGMTPSYILANIMDCGVVDFYSYLKNVNVKGGLRYKNKEKKAFEYKKVLIFDDSIVTGTSNKKVKKEIDQLFLSEDVEFLFGVVFATQSSKQFIDYYFELVEYPRVFQWNIFNHDIIENSCFDLDGVLCVDVPENVNDDGFKYVNYIENVEVLIKPERTIDRIVTCRLEKYREITEKWLRKNDIKYNELIMLDLPDGKSRRLWNKHGDFKASNCNNKHLLFVESSFEQAVTISNKTGKSVYCVDTNQMIFTEIEYVESNFISYIKKSLLVGRFLMILKKIVK